MMYDVFLTFPSFPFWQYFLNPKVAKEQVPPQLEPIAQEVLAPLISIFHQLVEDLTSQCTHALDNEKMLLILCKCIYFSVSIDCDIECFPCTPYPIL